MSLPVFTWVLDNSEATLGARLVLLVLAEHAHDDGRESYPALDTIAKRSRMTRKGVRDALRRLVEDGHIAEDGVAARGQTKWRILFKEGGQATTPPGVKLLPKGGVVPSPVREGTTPEPSLEPSKESSKEERAREDRRCSPPSDFPDELRPHARAILPMLEAIAEAHSAQKVWPLALGKTLMRFRHKPLVATAHELDRWAVDPPRPIKDVVGTYATFLGRARDLQGIERLSADGRPSRSAASSATVGRTVGKYDHLIVDEDDPDEDV